MNLLTRWAARAVLFASFLAPAVLVGSPAAVAANGPGSVSLTVGVISSRGMPAGAAQTLVATAWSARSRAAGGVFGQPVRLLLGDDGGEPAVALQLAREQVDEGALVLVCCTSAPATAAVAAFAEEVGVTLLAPRNWTTEAKGNYWAFSLAPSDTDIAAAIVADAYRHGRHSLGLLTPDDERGASVASDLGALGALVGIRLAADQRFEPGATELRPDALLVASQRPASVVVWGNSRDLATAADALDRRGYEGPVYGRTEPLYPGSSQPSWRLLGEMQFAVPPALVAPARGAATPVLPGERDGGDLGTCAAAASRDAGLIRGATGDPQFLATAPVLAALDLSAAAFEQLLALQVPLGNVAVMRQAVRDGLVGLSVHCSGAGAIDLEDDRRSAVLPRSLAFAAVTPTGLVLRSQSH